MEYSLYLNIINEDISKENDEIVKVADMNKDSKEAKPLAVNLPSHLKLK
tara:strand:- start:14531 stop:14677 length:147 start_codon:yes stop_codon:yes gene_type:complete